MQPERIILIPPTHEQSVFSFHVEESLSDRFLEFMKTEGLTPWRPPTAPEKLGPDGHRVMEIEVDSKRPESELNAFVSRFLSTVS